MKRLMLAVVALFTMATISFAQEKPATEKKAKTEKTSKKSEHHKKTAPEKKPDAAAPKKG